MEISGGNTGARPNRGGNLVRFVSGYGNHSRLVSVFTLIALVFCVVMAIVFAARLNIKARYSMALVPPKVSEWESQCDSYLLRQQHFPASIRPLKRVRVELNADDVARAVEKLRVGRFPGLPILLHSAMVFGWDMKVPEYPPPNGCPTLKEVVCNYELGRKYFLDGSVFVETSWGLRNRVQVPRDQRWQNERQAHPGQLLAELGKQGVPLEQKLTTEEGFFNVKDLVRDTIANYSHEEPQIEWICMALMLYLPPQKTWTDKFGHQFSFDDMAEELMRRKFDSTELSCHGIHLLESLVLLLRVDAQYSILSDLHRERVRQYVVGQVTHLVKTQLPDGSWPKTWSHQDRVVEPQRSDSEADRHVRVHVTGHHVDWMLLLPSDMMPPEHVFHRAVPWLLRCLLDCDEKDIINNYCPYSHAAHVLTVLTSETSQAGQAEWIR